MRKELTWVSFALLASVFIVFVLLGNTTLDLRIRDNTLILPNWTWAVPVFFFLSFIVLFSQIRRDRYKGKRRCTAFLFFGIAMIIMLQFLRPYFVKLDSYLDKGSLWGFPIGTRDFLYSRHTLGVLSFLQLGILLGICYVFYFCWIRTGRSHVNYHKNQR